MNRLINQFWDWLEQRLTRHDEVVRQAIADGATNGYKISTMTGLGFGSIYPALHRLERQGKIGSCWLAGPYPRRKHYYILKGDRPLPMVTTF